MRKKCDKSKEGDLCYRQMNWIETFLNNATVKAELGAAADTEFASCNTEVNQGFMFQVRDPLSILCFLSFQVESKM